MAGVPASARSRRVEPKSNEGLPASARICTKGVRMSLDSGHGKRTAPQQRPGASGGGGGHEPAATTRGTPHGASGGGDGATPNWIRPWVPRIRRGEGRIRTRWPAEVKGRRGLWPGGGGRQGKREVGGRGRGELSRAGRCRYPDHRRSRRRPPKAAAGGRDVAAGGAGEETLRIRFG